MDSAVVRRLTTAALLHGERPLQQIGSLEPYERPTPKLRELCEAVTSRVTRELLIGECGSDKAHVATGLCVAACRQKRLHGPGVRSVLNVVLKLGPRDVVPCRGQENNKPRKERAQQGS
jgi:hypothetical protein